MILISLQSFVAYLFIKHHCTRVETVTLEPEQGEPKSEAMGDDIPFENQGKAPMHNIPLIFLSMMYMCRVYA